MSSFLSDLRFALRDLRRSPGFAATAVLSLALGIGATAAVFSVLYAVLLNPFPYRDSTRLGDLALVDKTDQFRGVGFSNAQRKILLATRAVESMVPEDGWNLTTTDGDLPEDVNASYLMPGYPNHWGTAAMMGRWLAPSDAPPGEEPARVVVLSYRFWQRYYNGDPTVVGKTIQLVRKNYEVVGVMPPRFRWREADIYVPLKTTLDGFTGGTIRLRPGVSKEAAAAELQPLLEQWAREMPDRYPQGKFRVVFRDIVDMYAKPMQAKLFLLFGAVASLLLIGCANVSILLLARGTRRAQELAVRAAVGAGRGRIVRQLLTESLVIAVAGASLGVLLAWRGLPLLVSWIPENSYPAETVISMNWPVLGFSVLLAVATAVLFGISPALQLSRPDLGRVMQAGTRRTIGNAQGKRTHDVLVAAQVALTLVMLALAGAAGKGFLKLMQTDLGYDPKMTMSLPIPVHENTYGTWEERARYFEQIRSHVAAMPQVVAAGISTNATPPSNGSTARIEIGGRADAEKPEVRLNWVSPEYFAVLKIPMVSGRLWDGNESRRGAPVAVVNQTMAKQFWPAGDAIGQKVRVPAMSDQPPYRLASKQATGWIQIVGIVADARNDGLRATVKPSLFVPYAIQMRMFTQILVRTRVEPLSILPEIRREVVQIDRDQQIMRVRDLDQWITGLPEYAQQRLIAMMFALFSVLGLMLAGAGLYSVVSYGVANRTNEFGIRMALGAKAGDVVGVVVRSTLTKVAGGLAAGILLSILVDRLAADWITESGRDPWILGGVTALLLLVAAIACLIPARRAATVDPMEALRHEG